MNQDDIMRMAQEGKSVVEQVHAYVSVNNTDFTSESMSAMVRDFIVAEREACAKLCQDKAMRLETKAQEAIEAGEHGEVNAIRSTAFQFSVCAAAIRARANLG